MANPISNEYEPDSVSPPGDTLLETIERLGMTRPELAERTAVSIVAIDGIMDGSIAISPDFAARLEVVFGVPARFWNTREQRYREFVARRDAAVRHAKKPGRKNKSAVQV